MAHNHDKEYRIRIVRRDGIEELSGWMSSTEQIVQTMLAVDSPQGNTYWLLVRDIPCLEGSDGQQIMEYPLMRVPSSRYIPHDTRHLQEVKSRDRWAFDCSIAARIP